MEAVAEHINEMQKIYEEYGHVFDELTRQYRDSHAHTKVHRSSPRTLAVTHQCLEGLNSAILWVSVS